jgi:hypothetical protein
MVIISDKHLSPLKPLWPGPELPIAKPWIDVDSPIVDCLSTSPIKRVSVELAGVNSGFQTCGMKKNLEFADQYRKWSWTDSTGIKEPRSRANIETGSVKCGIWLGRSPHMNLSDVLATLRCSKRPLLLDCIPFQKISSSVHPESFFGFVKYNSQIYRRLVWTVIRGKRFMSRVTFKPLVDF